MFYFAADAGQWKVLQENVDATFLSTKVAGGFVGCTFALYTTSLGTATDNSLHFDWFEYQGEDEVYKK